MELCAVATAAPSMCSDMTSPAPALDPATATPHSSSMRLLVSTTTETLAFFGFPGYIEYCVKYCRTFIHEQRVVSQQLFPLELSMNLHEVSVPQKCTSASVFKVTTFTNKTLTLC